MPGSGLPRCAVFLYEQPFQHEGMASKLTPAGWENTARGAQELWMQRSLRVHPWRTLDMASADLVVISANFSLLCSLGMQYTSFAQWTRVLRSAPPTLRLAINGSIARPRVATVLETSCMPPWMHAKEGPTRVMRIRDLATDANDVSSPAVLTGRRWLEPRSDAPPAERGRLAWRRLPLLFYAGHIPKLHIAPQRYQLWRQLHSLRGVTALSSTLNCTVRPMEICTEPARLADGAAYRTFCHAACAHLKGGGPSKLPQRTRNGTLRKRPPKACAASADQLRKQCRQGGYDRNVDWAAERRAMEAATVELGTDEYAAHAMGHRFCLAAPGDYLTTPKFSEFALAAARGGCIPVLVLPDSSRSRRARKGPVTPQAAEGRWRALPAAGRAAAESGGEPFTAANLASLESHASRLLPFSQFALDWCEMAYVLPQSRAKNMSAVLRLLGRVGAAQAARKRARCAEAAPSLSYSADDPRREGGPGAVSHVLSELCQAAAGGAGLRPPTFDERCLLLPG